MIYNTNTVDMKYKYIKYKIQLSYSAIFFYDVVDWDGEREGGVIKPYL